jgi:hypothetical protein
MFKSVIGAALVAALATFSAMPAAAQNNQNQPLGGILPLVAGPIGAAAIVGTTTNVAHKSFSFWKWQGYGWGKVHHLKQTGWDIDITKKFNGKKIKVHAERKTTSKTDMGKAVVGCIFGSAVGAISSSVRKASAMGNPIRWRSQAEHEQILASGYEKQFELTNGEAQTATAFCGLGSFALHWPQQ